MKSVRDAEKKEADLSCQYDYAGSKGDNGIRRQSDILKKLDPSTPEDNLSRTISRKIQNFGQKDIDAKIDPLKPFLLESGSIVYRNQENNDLFSRVIKFGRSNPRRVVLTFGINGDCANICGMPLGHGCVCTRPPVEGRKRCPEHKGMKANGSKHDLISVKSSFDGASKDPYPYCGFISNNGTVCTNQAVHGRKRCEEHKGRKVKQYHEHVSRPGLDSTPCSSIPERSKPEEGTVEVGFVCGANLEDGTLCSRQPVMGRKRCGEHRGLRIKGSKPLPGKDGEVDKYSVTTCGVILGDGSSCGRKPVEGRKRCSEHKGMRVNTARPSPTSSSMFDCERAPSDTCGAGLRDGIGPLQGADPRTGEV